MTNRGTDDHRGCTPNFKSSITPYGISNITSIAPLICPRYCRQTHKSILSKWLWLSTVAWGSLYVLPDHWDMLIVKVCWQRLRWAKPWLPRVLPGDYPCDLPLVTPKNTDHIVSKLQWIYTHRPRAIRCGWSCHDSSSIKFIWLQLSFTHSS